MAQSTYSRWFNQFEFPNEEGLPYKSNCGKFEYNEKLKREIPIGWEIKKIGDFCDCLLGGTPSKSKPEYWSGDIKWINSGKVNDFRINEASDYITKEGLENSSTKLLPQNTVVLAITGATLGQVSITNIETCANQSVVGILQTDDIQTSFIYPTINFYMKKLKTNQTGNTQQHITKEDISSLEFCYPEQELLEKYYKVCNPYYDEIMNLEKETQKLQKLKNKLLPLLINGQLKV